MERSLRGVTRVAWAQYEATAPEIPQLTMEPELAIVVVETGKAPNARVGAAVCVARVFRIGTRNHRQHVDSQRKVSSMKCPLVFGTKRSF